MQTRPHLKIKRDASVDFGFWRLMRKCRLM